MMYDWSLNIGCFSLITIFAAEGSYSFAEMPSTNSTAPAYRVEDRMSQSYIIRSKSVDITDNM